MASQWYYTQDGVRQGPCSAKELRALAAAGTIRPTDTVWMEGVAQGALASNVKNLFPAVAAAAAAAAVTAEVPPPAPASEAVPEPVAEPAAAAPPAREAESPFHEKPVQVAPPPAKPKQGRATAVQGCVVVSQDGSRVHYRKKCTVCGHEDHCRSSMPIRNGMTRLVYYCPECRKARPIVIQGAMV
jgi:hypothetical protein